MIGNITKKNVHSVIFSLFCSKILPKIWIKQTIKRMTTRKNHLKILLKMTTLGNLLSFLQKYYLIHLVILPISHIFAT